MNIEHIKRIKRSSNIEQKMYDYKDDEKINKLINESISNESMTNVKLSSTNNDDD